jgi:Na+/melibiose symporter-like transporter
MATAIAFSTTNMPLLAIALVLSVYLPRHYGTHIGISLAAVGAAFGIVRLIDLPVDLALGWAMDRTRTTWGRYRVWTILAAPILALAGYMLVLAPPGVDMAYLIVWLLVLYFGTSILYLAQAAWAATLAPAYDDRSRLYGIIATVGVVASVLVLLLPIVADEMGKPDYVGVQAMGWFIVVAAPLTVLIAVISTRETIAPDVPGHRFSIGEYGRLILRPSMLRVTLAQFFLSLGPQWTGALYIFFFTDRLGFTVPQCTVLLLVYMAAGFMGAPLIARLAMTISKHRAAMLCLIGWSLILASLMVAPRANMVVGGALMFLLGGLQSGFVVLTRAMTADIADEVRLEQGVERSGVLFAVMTMIEKLAGAMSIFLTFQILGLVGYKGEGHDTLGAVHGMVLAYIIGPVVFMFVAGLCLTGYKLSKARHAEIRQELDARDAALAAGAQG